MSEGKLKFDFGFINRSRHMLVKSLLILLSIVTLFSALYALGKNLRVYASAPGNVVISEIMYNPGTGNQDDEFLELYNLSDATVDISGWRFSDGITLEFSEGTLIGPSSYVIISPNSVQTQTTYGVEPLAVFQAGNLSNGGETITLRDDSENIVSSVTYDDSSPWPTSPDGIGPSLELKNLETDISQSNSWGASLDNGGTPGQENSLNGLSLPSVSNVTLPTNINATEAVVINALITGEGITGVTLQYLVNFETYVDLEMYDDGAHNDGLAGDDIYGATIPGHPAGTLMRYAVIASNASGTTSAPHQDDSQDYVSYIVNDGTTSDLPILRWYMDTADFTDMTTNHLSDDEYFPAVVALENQIFDNAKVRVKGGSSVNFAKRKYKFELPAGYTIQQSGFGDHIDEFSIQAYFLNSSEFPEKLVNMALDKFEEPALLQRFVRVHKNDIGPSDFYGHYLFSETYDNTWRERNGFDTGALYKEVLDKKTRTDEDTSDIDNLITNVTTLEGDELKQYIFDNINIANVINYNAIMSVLRVDDWFLYHNQYQYRDTEGTERWQYLPWDYDNSFSPVYLEGAFGYSRSPIIDPLPHNQSSEFYIYRFLERAMFQFQEFEDMYYRRVATIFDELYTDNLTKQWYQSLYTQSYDTLLDDINKWGSAKNDLYQLLFGSQTFDFPEDLVLSVGFENLFIDGTPEDIKAIFDYGEDDFKSKMLQLRSDGALPQPQQDDVAVEIITVNVSDGARYVEILNPQNVSVDISGWEIPELNFSFRQGSVIPGGSTAFVVENDPQFRQDNPGGFFVLGAMQAWQEGLSTLTILNAQGDQIFTLSLGESNSNQPVTPVTRPSIMKTNRPNRAKDNISTTQEEVLCQETTCETGTPVKLNGGSAAENIQKQATRKNLLTPAITAIGVVAVCFMLLKLIRKNYVD